MIYKDDELKARTKQFAIRTFKLCRVLQDDEQGKILSRQLLRSSTSIAANYRAVCRARSKPEFIAKLGIVVEEADETVFWLEFLGDAGLLPQDRLRDLVKEANELLAIFAASQHTARNGKRTSVPGQ